jgi:hypothetical protein
MAAKGKYGPVNRLVRNIKGKIEANKSAKKIQQTANLKFNRIKNALMLRSSKVKISYEALSKEYNSKQMIEINKKLSLLEKRAQESHKRIVELKGGFIKQTNNLDVINRKKIAEQLLKCQEVKSIPKRAAINPESQQPNQGKK